MCRAFKAIVRTFAYNLSEVGNWGVLSRGKIRFALLFKSIILIVLLSIDCRGQSARRGVRRPQQVMVCFPDGIRGPGKRGVEAGVDPVTATYATWEMYDSSPCNSQLRDL